MKIINKNIALLALSSILSFVCLSAQNTKPEVNWVFESDGRIYSTPVLDGGSIYFGSGDNHIYSVSKKGKLIWKYNTEGKVHSTPFVDESKVYIASGNGTLHCLNKKTGKLIWQFDAESEKPYGLWDYYLSSPIIEEGILYWGSGDHNIYALNPQYGNELWRFETEGVVHATPVVNEEGVFIGSFDGYLYKLNKYNGALVWKFKTIGTQYFPKGEIQKAVTIHNDLVYFGSRDYNFYVVNAKTGTGSWNYRLPNGWIIATPLIYNNHIYYGSSDGHKLYCFNIKTKEKVWEKEISMRVFAAATPYKESILFATFDGKVLAVDPKTGTTNWEFQTQASKDNYHHIFKVDGTFKDGFELYGADYLKSEKMIHDLGSILSTPVVDDVGNIYFGSSDGNLYSLKVK